MVETFDNESHVKFLWGLNVRPRFIGEEVVGVAKYNAGKNTNNGGKNK
jgi:hypothetical protein